MSDFRLSLFNTAYDTIGTESHIDKELKDIMLGKYKTSIEKCRNALLVDEDKESYKKNKSKLKAVTFCGLFENGRKLEHLVKYNRLVVIDIDDIQNVQNIKSRLSLDGYIMALWLSPSSLGLKGLIKIDSSVDNHKKYFYSLSVYFLQNYGVELDKSGSDITRLCYVSWDPEIYINYDSKIFNEIIDLPLSQKSSDKNKIPEPTKTLVVPKNAFATEGLNKAIDRQLLKKITSYLTSKNLSITYDFSNWVKVAVIVANSFSYDLGEGYFLTLCRLDGITHNEERSKELLKYCYANRNLNLSNRISIATLLYLAKKKGFVKR